MDKKEFKAKRVTKSYQQTINAPPSAVFPLLCPVREADWLYGWDCEVVYSESGFAEEGGVFISNSSNEGEAGTIWLITKRDEEQKEIEFARITPNSRAARLVISVEETEEIKSLVNISYTFTALNEKGNRFIEDFTEEKFSESMKFWEDSMNHYLKTGEQLVPQST